MGGPRSFAVPYLVSQFITSLSFGCLKKSVPDWKRSKGSFSGVGATRIGKYLWLDGLQCAWIRAKVASRLKVSLRLIRHCLASGAGGLPMKGTRFGGRLFAVNLESLAVDGIPVISKAVMDLVYGRISGKNDPVFFQNSVFALGDGRRINFWKDVWCGEEALCVRYPVLFNLALNKEAKVADMWDSGGGGGSWSPTFIRALNDWEIEEMARFLQTLYEQSFRTTGEDMLLLKEAKGKSFSVKVMYKGYDLSPTCDFPHRLIWNSVAPPKMGIFFLRSSLGQILTLDNLKRRGVAFANRCFMCEEDEEIINHLLIHCKSAKMLWDLFLTMVGISWVFPHSVLHTLLAWQGGAVGKKRKKIWTAAPSCIFWAL